MITIRTIYNIFDTLDRPYETRFNNSLSIFGRFLYTLGVPFFIIISIILDILFSFIEIPYLIYLEIYFRNEPEKNEDILSVILND